ncbi:MAG: M12 family metallo-peptidase [Acidobacteriota bacterium]
MKRIHLPLSSSIATHIQARFAVILTLALVAAPGSATPSGTIGGADAHEVPIGEIFASDTLGAFAEAFDVPTTLAQALMRSGPAIRLEGFPVGPGARGAVALEPFEVYAPGARLLAVDEDGERQIPRSALRHFLGHVANDPETRIGLSLDPETGTLRGLISGPAGEVQLLPPDASAGRHRLEHTDAALAVHGLQLATECASDHLPLPDTMDDLLVRAPGASAAPAGQGELGIVPTHSATIAVDTDAELLDKKFSNNTTAASNWLASLFTQMNVAYERDVGLTLLLGDSILRTGSPPYTSDPYNVTGSPASSAHLNEFGSFWSSTMGGVDRVLAMLLSGKSSSNNSASGIAWVDGYCETQNTGGGYSVTQVFIANFSSATIVAHELGHNFGSPHTHCYSPPVDQCFNAEAGCYSGTVSCPGGPGTTMSYCNFGPPSGAACGQNRLEFHPTVVSLFDSFIATHTPGCVELLDTAEIFADGFESGDTSGWT